MADLFKEKAQEWDGRPISQQLSGTIGPAIIEHVALHPHMRVMDFGAGTGLLSSAIAPHVGHIAAVDISQAMLDQLIAKPELKGKVTAYCQNILELPLDQEFDLIISAMAMHHVENTELLIERFAQHLCSGGHIALADLDTEDGNFHPPHAEGIFHYGFDREHFKSILEKAGFTDIRFLTAHIIIKDGTDYPIFLVLGHKK